MSDSKPYKIKPSTDPKRPGYSVIGPDGTIANQAVMTKEEAELHCDRLNAFGLYKSRRGDDDLQDMD